MLIVNEIIVKLWKMTWGVSPINLTNSIDDFARVTSDLEKLKDVESDDSVGSGEATRDVNSVLNSCLLFNDYIKFNLLLFYLITIILLFSFKLRFSNCVHFTNMHTFKILLF